MYTILSTKGADKLAFAKWDIMAQSSTWDGAVQYLYILMQSEYESCYPPFPDPLPVVQFQILYQPEHDLDIILFQATLICKTK